MQVYVYIQTGTWELHLHHLLSGVEYLDICAENANCEDSYPGSPKQQKASCYHHHDKNTLQSHLSTPCSTPGLSRWRGRSGSCQQMQRLEVMLWEQRKLKNPKWFMKNWSLQWFNHSNLSSFIDIPRKFISSIFPKGSSASFAQEWHLSSNLDPFRAFRLPNAVGFFLLHLFAESLKALGDLSTEPLMSSSPLLGCYSQLSC